MMERGCTWEDVNNWNEERILNVKDENKRGYIFQVDLEYPKKYMIHTTNIRYAQNVKRCVQIGCHHFNWNQKIN